MTKQRFVAATRTEKVNAFKVMDVLERARALQAGGRDIIHLEVGEPDFTTAPAIVEAGVHALQQGRTAYTGAAGLPELRERIAAFYQEQHGVRMDARRVLITPGASGALTLLANLLLNPGDRVLMPDPSYPCNRNYVTLAGAQAVLIKPDQVGAAAPSCAQLDAHADAGSGVRGVWLASPVNPTGAVLQTGELARLAQWCAQRDAHLLVDEIYHGLDFCKPAAQARRMGDLPSALTVDSNVIVVNSFSKYFGMTGWRVGWMVVPEALIERATILAQNLFIAAPTAAQHAAVRAFDSDVVDELEQRRQAFRERRDFLAGALQNLGFGLPWQPDGAFYCYADISRFAEHCEPFCQYLLEEHGVAATPGTDFGVAGAERFMRLAYTQSIGTLEQAVERLARAVQQV